jgi:replicative DNA helicase
MASKADPTLALPHSEEAERAVLACVLLSPNLLALIDLAASDFYFERHGLIWAAYRRITKDGGVQSIDLRTVHASLETAGSFEAAGGLAFLAGLDQDLPDLTGFDRYASIVRDRSIRRKLIRGAHDLATKAREADSAAEAVAWGERSLRRIGESLNATGSVDLEAALTQALPPEQEPEWVRSGYPTLDRIGVFERSRLVIMAGRPSHGKSSLALHVGVNAARNGHRVLFLPLEMKARHLMARWMSAASGADFENYRLGRVTADQRTRAANAGYELVNLGSRFVVHDGYDMSPEQAAVLIRQEDARQSVDMVILDYLGLLKLRNPEETTIHLGEASRLLKMLAEELDILVVVVHQMNRKIEDRPNPVPILADLRASGRLEEDADGVIFCVIPAKFEQARLEHGAELTTDPDQMLALVRKNRDGKTPDVVLRFDREHQRITEVDARQPPRGDYPASWDEASASTRKEWN